MFEHALRKNLLRWSPFLFAGLFMVLLPQSSKAVDALGYIRPERAFQGHTLQQSGVGYERVSSIVHRIQTSNGLRPLKVFVASGSREVNAVVTSDGSVIVYEELLRRVQDTDELATVIAHEVAHLVGDHLRVNARHLASSVDALPSLPHVESVTLELDADRLGVFLMARAGYDPRAAVALWERAGDVFSTPLSAAESFAQQSSHPSFSSRAAALREILPLAWSEYLGSLKGHTRDLTDSEGAASKRASRQSSLIYRRGAFSQEARF